jgi:hypothetical protein
MDFKTQLPQTDEEVFAKFVAMYGDGITAGPMYGIYSIYRERDGLNVLDAYTKALRTYMEIAEKKGK